MSYYDHFWLRVLASVAIAAAGYGLIYVLFSFIEGGGRVRGRPDPRGAPRVVTAHPVATAAVSLAAEPAADGPDLETAWAELEDLMAQHLAIKARGGGER
ncbi:MAG: hypothetical protein H8D78_17120 [Chloroflexi bacterium]|nr:hypothetical protein [Chloroflexota bacterium]